MTGRDRYITAPDGSIAYVTIDGDMVDEIARGFYGKHAGSTELVLEANSGLADRGKILEAGVVVKIPPAPASPQAKPFKHLWD